MEIIMKKRNKILALILAVTMPFSFTACGSEKQDGGATAQQEADASDKGDDSQATEEKSAADILADAQEKMKGVKSIAAKMVMEMDMDMEANGEKQSVQSVTNYDMDCIYDPLKIKIDMSMDMGQTGSTSMQMYAQEKDGKYTLYISDGTQWQSQSVQLEDLGRYDAAASMEEYLNENYNFEVAGTEQVDGKNAYKLTGKITGDDMKDTMLSSGALDSLNTLNIDSSQIDSLIDGLGDIPVIIWVDEQSSYVLKYDMDMSEVMSTLLPKLIESMGEQAEGLTMNISKLKMEMTCSDYDAVEDFSIPKEAKKA